MNAKVAALLGLARKAGKIAGGGSGTEALLKKRKGFLLVAAADAPNALKKYGAWTKDIGVPLIVEGNKRELGAAVGMSPLAVILVMDAGFARA
ncbi:MAG: ribosomal L7Ae/L30e/S12e/Gadd45 family protein, partial [Gracilibacteraceae bacterium]|nr:ribosomal L7Ae/L30e/S12e/Gadd45 family protein [Gracilibacteraceae bacterium]